MLTHLQNLTPLKDGQTLAVKLFVIDLRLTIQPSLAAILTIGLTPQAAIAATASCMAPSIRSQHLL